MRRQWDRDECPYCGYDDQPLFMLNAYIIKEPRLDGALLNFLFGHEAKYRGQLFHRHFSHQHDVSHHEFTQFFSASDNGPP